MKKVIAMLLVAVLALTLVLSVSAEGESWVDSDTGISYLQLLNCDTKPGGRSAYEVDVENAQEGDACLTFNVGSGQVNEMILEEAIDGTGYDTLEFELYVSDLALFDKFGAGGMNSGFELTSSGMCDYQEISWKLAEIRDNHAGDELVEGWNHIILPLNTAVTRDKGSNHDELTGPFDIANINFMRFFMVNDDGSGIVVKVDNICLSDRQAVNAEAEKQAALKKSADKVIEKINELPEITAENYQDYKLKVASARSLYDKLSEEGQEYVPTDLLKKLQKAEAAIAHYEANPPSEEQPDDQQPDGEKPDDDQQPDDDSKGCKSMMSVGAVAMIVMALSLGVTVLNKKKG